MIIKTREQGTWLGLGASGSSNTAAQQRTRQRKLKMISFHLAAMTTRTRANRRASGWSVNDATVATATARRRQNGNAHYITTHTPHAPNGMVHNKMKSYGRERRLSDMKISSRNWSDYTGKGSFHQVQFLVLFRIETNTHLNARVCVRVCAAHTTESRKWNPLNTLKCRTARTERATHSWNVRTFCANYKYSYIPHFTTVCVCVCVQKILDPKKATATTTAKHEHHHHHIVVDLSVPCALSLSLSQIRPYETQGKRARPNPLYETIFHIFRGSYHFADTSNCVKMLLLIIIIFRFIQLYFLISK